MRALEPRISDFVDRDGLRVHYEVYGEGDLTVFLLMPDTIVHSRAWKAQIPFLARFCQVVVIDPRGNGGSGRPTPPPPFDMIDYFAHPLAGPAAIGVREGVLGGPCSRAGPTPPLADGPPPRGI